MTLFSLLLALLPDASASNAVALPAATDDCLTTMEVSFGENYSLDSAETVTIQVGRSGDKIAIEHAKDTAHNLCLDNYDDVSPFDGILVKVTNTTEEITGSVDMLHFSGSSKKRTFNVPVATAQTIGVEQTEDELTVSATQEVWLLDMQVVIRHKPRDRFMVLVAVSERTDPVNATVKFGDEPVVIIEGLIPMDGVKCEFVFQPDVSVPVTISTETNDIYTEKGYAYGHMVIGGADFALPARLDPGPRPFKGFTAEDPERWLELVDGTTSSPDTVITVTEAGAKYGMTCSQ